MNHKRRKSKRSVRCTVHTTWRWRGNGRERFNHNTRRRLIAVMLALASCLTLPACVSESRHRATLANLADLQRQNDLLRDQLWLFSAPRWNLFDGDAPREPVPVDPQTLFPEGK